MYTLCAAGLVVAYETAPTTKNSKNHEWIWTTRTNNKQAYMIVLLLRVYRVSVLCLQRAGKYSCHLNGLLLQILASNAQQTAHIMCMVPKTVSIVCVMYMNEVSHHIVRCLIKATSSPFIHMCIVTKRHFYHRWLLLHCVTVRSAVTHIR